MLVFLAAMGCMDYVNKLPPPESSTFPRLALSETKQDTPDPTIQDSQPQEPSGTVYEDGTDWNLRLVNRWNPIPEPCHGGGPACQSYFEGGQAMMEKSRAWIELDRAALRHNVEALRKRLPPGCALMPVLKANAYGHGAVTVARECQRMGVGAFCVATLEEGIELRQAGVEGDILVLGWTDPRQAILLHEHTLSFLFAQLIGPYQVP